MSHENQSVFIALLVIALSHGVCLAACPSGDLTGDCFVNYEDFALMAAQWLSTDPCIPDDMVYIPGGTFEMGDHFNEGSLEERHVHTVTVDSFFMGTYLITNQQYCDYLNSAYDACDLRIDHGVVFPFSDPSDDARYCYTSDYWAGRLSQIDYNDVCGTFSVRTKGGRDMSNDPIGCASWYGAVAYCNWRSRQEGYEQCYNLSNWACDFSKKGYRLATEAEWEYAARGGLSGRRFPWGDTISHSQANYYSDWSRGMPDLFPYDVSPTEGYHPIWDDGIEPYTSPVGSFSANGYGLYDIAGNLAEWCNDWWDKDYYDYSPENNPTGPASPIADSYRVYRCGTWATNAYACRIACRTGASSSYANGFRIVLNLN